MNFMRELCDCHAAVCRAVHTTTVVDKKGSVQDLSKLSHATQDILGA